MYGSVDAEVAWAARSSVDFALEALSHARALGWSGAAAQSASEWQLRLLSDAYSLRMQIHEIALLLEEIAVLKAVALREVGG